MTVKPPKKRIWLKKVSYDTLNTKFAKIFEIHHLNQSFIFIFFGNHDRRLMEATNNNSIYDFYLRHNLHKHFIIVIILIPMAQRKAQSKHHWMGHSLVPCATYHWKLTLRIWTPNLMENRRQLIMIKENDFYLWAGIERHNLHKHFIDGKLGLHHYMVCVSMYHSY